MKAMQTTRRSGQIGAVIRYLIIIKTGSVRIGGNYAIESS